MKKRFLAGIMAALLTVSLTACGANNKTQDENGPSDDVQAVQPTATEDANQSPAGDEGQAGNEQDGAADGQTLGQGLLEIFRSNAEGEEPVSLQTIADAILESDLIAFSGMSVEVEEGYLSGFDNTEIAGFTEGIKIVPMIGSIPFVGYVFTLDEETDAEAFVQMLKDNADTRWLICDEADETVVDAVGNKVFFLMCANR